MHMCVLVERHKMQHPPTHPHTHTHAHTTYISGLDAKSLGNGLIQLLHIGKVTDLTGGGAVSQLAVEDHVKLLGRCLGSSWGRGWNWLILLSHGCLKYMEGEREGEQSKQRNLDDTEYKK